MTSEIRWRLVKSIRLTDRQLGKSVLISSPLSRPCIKIQTVSKSTPKRIVKDTWRRAGFLYPVAIDGRKEVEISQLVVPLNQTSVLRFQLQPYEQFLLRFKPVDYLPNLQLTIWEVVGDAWQRESVTADDGEVLDDGQF